MAQNKPDEEKPDPEAEYDNLLELWDPHELAADIVLTYGLAGRRAGVVRAAAERAMWEMGFKNKSYIEVVVQETQWVSMRA